MITLHTGFVIIPCSFFDDRGISYIGATPDALVIYICCGMGVVKIKGPWCARNAE